MPGPLVVRVISDEEHLDLVRRRPSASFLQTPAWGRVKAEWRAESLGWFAGDALVGAALVLHRPLPRLRRSFAYLPEGPLLDWDTASEGRLADWLDPLVAHLRTQGAFGVRMGPPVVTRRWSAAQVKEGIADPAVRRLGDLAPQVRDPVGARVVAQLRELGWRPQATDGGFAAGQPQYVFRLPLVDGDGARRTEAGVLAGMNQLWRRNIKRADKSSVEVTRSVTPVEDLKLFHDLYVHTAERDHFTPRPLAYFRTMLEAMTAEEPAGSGRRITLWLARHEGDLVAATLGIRVGDHAWYSYGASSSEKREVRGSNAVQWAMIRDAIATGATVHDLRGITDTLDPEDPHVGLVQFKVGTGGEAVEYAGEWDLPLHRLLYRAFRLYLSRR